MRLLSWNILAGGGKRFDDIFTAIISHGPDIIYLQELRKSTFEKANICERFKEMGYPYFYCATPPHGRINSTGFFSKYEFIPKPIGGLLEITDTKFLERLNHRMKFIYIPEKDMFILGLHIPFSDIAESELCWKMIHNTIRDYAHQRLMIIGDLNTGMRSKILPSADARFSMQDAFKTMVREGMLDAWRLKHWGQKMQFTWHEPVPPYYGSRINHVFISHKLTPGLRMCEYSHLERENKLSDHSLIVCEISTPNN